MINNRRMLGRAAAFAVALAVPVMSGCDLDELLEAEDPFSVTPETARDTVNLETLYAGSRSQFALGYAGLQNNYGGIIQSTGLFSDEMYAADNFNTRRNLDLRDIDYLRGGYESDENFTDLQRARAEAVSAIEIYEGSPRAGGPRHAELYSIAAYSVLMLAENFCSGVPLGLIAETEVVYGDQLTTEQLYDISIGYFDDALGQNSSGAAQANLARVGKARALLDKGDFAGAASVASAVPTSFSFAVEYAAGSFETPNAVFNFINEEHRMSVSLQEGTANRGLNFGARATAGDPRIAISATPAPSNSGEVDVWEQLKYPSQGASIPLATGVEARLIEAEAALSLGTSAAYLTTLNSLRAGIGLDPLTDPGSAAARVDQFFAERAYWLWLTGHRLSDLRRLIRQYGRTQAQVFPTGNSRFGEPYESDVSLPIPFAEVNNPNYSACLNTGA